MCLRFKVDYHSTLDASVTEYRVYSYMYPLAFDLLSRPKYPFPFYTQTHKGEGAPKKGEKHLT